MMKKLSVVVCVGMLFLANKAWAEKNVELAPKLASVGKLLVVEAFEGELPEKVKGVKGTWEVSDGVLRGKELASDKHAAVANYEMPNKDSVVRFAFKVAEDTTGFHFSLNKSRGHLFRVVVTPRKVTLSLDKDKKDPESKPKALASASAEFKKDVWYTMQVEMVGDKVVVQTDNDVLLKASHEKLDEQKPNYRFVMRGDSLQIDDLHIWAVK